MQNGCSQTEVLISWLLAMPTFPNPKTWVLKIPHFQISAKQLKMGKIGEICQWSAFQNAGQLRSDAMNKCAALLNVPTISRFLLMFMHAKSVHYFHVAELFNVGLKLLTFSCLSEKCYCSDTCITKEFVEHLVGNVDLRITVND